ncbi:MAG: pyridoxal-phosphate dependent enzyme, partial [Candidatus Methanomethylicaceae archaeon]
MYPKSKLRCINCGKEYDSNEIVYTCRICNSLLEVIIEVPKISLKDMKKREFGVWRYREFIPIENDYEIITLKEGGTPLYECNRLAKLIGIKKLYIKYEGTNPTGSFKDRGMTVGVT